MLDINELKTFSDQKLSKKDRVNLREKHDFLKKHMMLTSRST